MRNAVTAFFKVLGSYIPTFLHSYIPTCLHSYIPVGLDSLGTTIEKTGLTLETCATSCKADRTLFLTKLRELGISKVSDRQAFANAMGKAMREGWLRAPYKGPFTQAGRELRHAREVCVGM